MSDVSKFVDRIGAHDPWTKAAQVLLCPKHFKGINFSKKILWKKKTVLTYHRQVQRKRRRKTGGRDAADQIGKKKKIKIKMRVPLCCWTGWNCETWKRESNMRMSDYYVNDRNLPLDHAVHVDTAVLHTTSRKLNGSCPMMIMMMTTMFIIVIFCRQQLAEIIFGGWWFFARDYTTQRHVFFLSPSSFLLPRTNSVELGIQLKQPFLQRAPLFDN